MHKSFITISFHTMKIFLIVFMICSPILEISYLFAEMVQHGLRCITFCKTRKLSELVLCYTYVTSSSLKIPAGSALVGGICLFCLYVLHTLSFHDLICKMATISPILTGVKSFKWLHRLLLGLSVHIVVAIILRSFISFVISV